jgi:hypothetical protein
MRRKDVPNRRSLLTLWEQGVAGSNPAAPTTYVKPIRGSLLVENSEAGGVKAVVDLMERTLDRLVYLSSHAVARFERALHPAVDPN